jgi:hypothetical protein
MLERTPVMTAKIAVIEDRNAVRDVCAAAIKHAAATPTQPPGAETPAKASKHTHGNADAEGKSKAQDDAGGRHNGNPSRPRCYKSAPNCPGIVIRNVNHGRIHRCDGDDAGVHRHGLLRRGSQPAALLRLQPHSLYRVLNVTRLVEIGVPELRRPGGVFRQIIEDGRKLDQGFD